MWLCPSKKIAVDKCTKNWEIIFNSKPFSVRFFHSRLVVSYTPNLNAYWQLNLCSVSCKVVRLAVRQCITFVCNTYALTYCLGYMHMPYLAASSQPRCVSRLQCACAVWPTSLMLAKAKENIFCVSSFFMHHIRYQRLLNPNFL